MKERPILFRTDMIRAILNTKPGVWPAEPIDPAQPFKWQTRRVCGKAPAGSELRPKPPGSYYKYHLWNNDTHAWKEYHSGPLTQWMLSYVCEQSYSIDPTNPYTEQATREWESTPVSSPYGQSGDRLWVKETWAVINSFDHLRPSQIPKGSAGWPVVWYSVPETASASIKNTRAPVGRVRPSIFMPRWASRIDLEIKAIRVERVQQISDQDVIAEGIAIEWPGPGPEPYRRNLPAVYSYLWDRINAKRGYSWSTNPWTWVIEFMRLT